MFDRSGTFLVSIGPMGLSEFRQFLPGGAQTGRGGGAHETVCA